MRLGQKCSGNRPKGWSAAFGFAGNTKLRVWFIAASAGNRTCCGPTARCRRTPAQAGRPGSGAGLALAPIDLPGVLEIAQFAVRSARSRATTNRRRRSLRCSVCLIAGTSRRARAPGTVCAGPQRRDAGAEQRLAHIDVAQTGHDLLVEQRGFDRRLLAVQRGGQNGDRECVIQRFRSEPGQQPVLVFPIASPPDRPTRSGADRRSRPASRRPSPSPGARAEWCRCGRPAPPPCARTCPGAAAPTTRCPAASGCIWPRRRKPVTRAPVSVAARPGGKGQRRSGRRATARNSTRPSRRAWRPRITVSTSGSSGIRGFRLYIRTMTDNPATTVDFGFRRWTQPRRRDWCAPCSTAWRRATT